MEIKGKRKEVIQGNPPQNFEVQTFHETNLLHCDIVMGDLKMKGNKLSEIIGTRVINMQGYIKEIIHSLSQID